MINDFSCQNDLKVIQITDTHLVSSTKKPYGIDTNAHFIKVIQDITANELQECDFILLTGDLSQDETPDSYKYLLETLKACLKPVFWIPGNHDNLKVMKTVFHDISLFNYPASIELKHWIFVFMNTKFKYSLTGHVKASDFKNIKIQLAYAKKTNKNIALIMHHHPTPINTPFMDQYGLNNSDELWDLIVGTNTKITISGHVHNNYSFIYRGIQVECSPATCFQIQQGVESLQIENSIGYKIHYFNSDKYHSKAVLF